MVEGRNVQCEKDYCSKYKAAGVHARNSEMSTFAMLVFNVEGPVTRCGGCSLYSFRADWYITTSRLTAQLWGTK